MADFSNIIQEINDDINTNGVGTITGAKLNEVLRDMIDAVNDEKQDPLTIDAIPTENSTNPVQSGGVYDALEDKADKVSGATNGNIASFDANGNIQDSGIAASDVATDSDLAGKQDVITDLAAIRSGAAAGATAYQKPSGGIPKNDLASGVQTSLGKADTAVQQVTVGTTTTGVAGTNASVTNSGTVTNPVLDFTIPRGADGADGQDGADAVNPFKGWYNSLAELKAAHTAIEGDSAYVKDASPATTWSIYVYDATATTDKNWADSGTDADTSNVQTFASGQEVNEVHIVNNLTTGGVDDVLTAEQGKVLYEDLYNEGYISILNQFTQKTGQIDNTGYYTTSGQIYELELTQELKATYAELLITGTVTEGKQYSYIYFSKQQLTTITYGSVMISSYSSTIMGNDLRLNIPRGKTMKCVIPPDANYIYIMKNYGSGDITPIDVLAKKWSYEIGDIVADKELKNQYFHDGKNQLIDYLSTTSSLINYNGTVSSIENCGFSLFIIKDCYKVDFLGRVTGDGISRTTGYCFLDIDGNLVEGKIYDSDNEGTNRTKNYSVRIPHTAVYFYTNVKIAQITEGNFYIYKYLDATNYKLVNRSVSLERGWLSTMEWPAWSNDYPNDVIYRNVKPYTIGNIASFPEMQGKGVITYNYIEASGELNFPSWNNAKNIDILQYDKDKQYIATIHAEQNNKLNGDTRFVKLRMLSKLSSDTLLLESGKINYLGNEETSDNTLRTNSVALSSFDYLDIPDGYKVFAYCYDDNNFVSQVFSVSHSDRIYPSDLIKYGTGNKDTLGKGYSQVKYVRFTVRKIDNSNITTSDLDSLTVYKCYDMYNQRIDIITTDGKDDVKHDWFGGTTNIAFPVVYDDELYISKMMVRLPITIGADNIVKSVFFRTGSSGSQSTGTNGWKFMNLTWDFNYGDYLQYLVDEGYCVFDVYGQTTRHPDRDSFATPIDFVSYRTAFDLLCKLFYIDKDCLYMMSKSLGGVIAANMLYHKELPVKAICMLAPAIHVPNILFGYELAERQEYIDDYGLEGDFSFILQNNPSTGRPVLLSALSEQNKATYISLLKENATKLYNNPLWMHTNLMPSDIIDIRWWDSETTYSNVIKYSDVPLFIEVAEDDDEVSLPVIRKLVESLHNSMSKVDIVWIESGHGGHHAVDSDENAPVVNVVTKTGISCTVPQAYHDALIFFENYK